MAVVVTSPGSCGEFIQGYRDGSSYMVTCPINRYSTAVAPSSKGTLPPKAEAAVEKTLAYLGETGRTVSVSLSSAIPWGKGLASSTADISAVCEAAALSCGRKLSAEEIASIALSIEPSDATFFPGIVQFDYREGKLIRGLGMAPAMDILIYDCGGEVDTVGFNSRRGLIALQQANQPETDRALRLFEEGMEQQSLSLIGEASTISAFANQRILRKEPLQDFYDTGRAHGAEGVICAHSGTVLGLILPPGAADRELRAALENVKGVTFLDRVSLTNRGMEVTETE